MSFFNDWVVPTLLAQPDDLADWIETDAPDNAIPLLRSASSVVLEATEADFYAVDASGLATDASILQAMQDATCIQAAAWIAIGFDPLTGGVQTPNVEQSTKIGTASIVYADSAQAAISQGSAATGIVPEAARRLRQVGLGGSHVWSIR